MRKRSLAFELFRHTVLLLGAAIMLAPFVWMIATSFKPPNEIFAGELTLLPKQWYGHVNYYEAFTKLPMLRYLINGVVVTSAIFCLQVLIAVPCAYALAKLDFRGRGFIFALMLFGLLIPAHVPAIPLYIMLWQVGLLNTYAALVIPFIISVFGIFLMRQFFKSIPDELIHAARLDGFSELAIVWRIMVPAAMPALISFGIFSVVAHWNDYFWPLLVINSRELAPPPLGVAYFRNEEAGHDFGPLMAGAVIMSAPKLYKAPIETIVAEFSRKNPGIKVNLFGPQQNYEQILQHNLRASITNTLPDVAIHGMNRQRLLVERGVAQPIDDLIRNDPEFAQLGITEKSRSVGMIGGKQYGIGLALRRSIAVAACLATSGSPPDQRRGSRRATRPSGPACMTVSVRSRCSCFQLRSFCA